MLYVTYDNTAGYPQPALFGRGVETSEGHTPPAGLVSFGVDEIALIHGTDERLYEVTAVDTLTPLNQVDVDDILLPDYKEYGYTVADNEAERRVALAELTPAIGQDLDENGRIRNNRRRNNKAKKKVNKITDADDHLLDHIDLIYDSAELRRDAIEAAPDRATIDNIIADIANDIHWPTWVPI